MPQTEKQENQPPPGYPTGNSPTGKMSRPYTRKKGEKGFIEGCLFALCCCWLCESCF
ncbi:hypothetical protein CsSME_00039309 [Camellia sinensis var. sinensis]